MIANFTIEWADGTTTISKDFSTSYGDEPLCEAQEELEKFPDRLSAQDIADMVNQIHRVYQSPNGELNLTTDTTWVAQHHGPDGTITLIIAARDQ